MKKTIIKISSLLVAGVILTTACTKTGATGPAGASGGTGATGANGPALTGTVVGYVDLFDQYGELLPASAAGEIYLTSNNMSGWKDSTYVSSGGANTYTAALTTGTYEFNLTSKMGGFGNLQINSMNFVGGATQYNSTHLQMTQVPTFSVTNLLAAVSTSTNNPAITTTITVSSVDPVRSRKAIIFFGSATTVSSNPSTYLGYTTATIGPNTSTVVVSLNCATTLYPNGADSASTIFLNAYPISYSNGASAYLDPSTGKTIFNNIGSSVIPATPTVVVP